MTSSKTRTSSPLQSTRQMLDELDTLMERMLALPVGDEEDLPPLPRDVPVQATVKATYTPIGETTGAEEAEEDSFADPQERSLLQRVDNLLADVDMGTDTSSPSYAADERLDFGSTAKVPHFAPEVVPDPFFADPEVPPPPIVRSAPAIPAAPAAPHPVVRPTPVTARNMQAVSLPLLPLLWVNQTFDACTSVLGPIGRGIRGERGHQVLGAVGLFCLGLAGLWFVVEQWAAR